MRLSDELDLPRDIGAPAVARRRLRRCFAHALATAEVDVLLAVVSELVANAVLHGRGAITVTTVVTGDVVRGEVRDEGDGFEAEVRERGVTALGGRGLWLVAQMAHRWGIHDGSSHVWFELDRTAAETPAAPPQLGTEQRPPAVTATG